MNGSQERASELRGLLIDMQADVPAATRQYEYPFGGRSARGLVFLHFRLSG
jgi:hypothetical protein